MFAPCTPFSAKSLNPSTRTYSVQAPLIRSVAGMILFIFARVWFSDRPAPQSTDVVTSADEQMEEKTKAAKAIDRNIVIAPGHIFMSRVVLPIALQSSVINRLASKLQTNGRSVPKPAALRIGRSNGPPGACDVLA